MMYPGCHNNEHPSHMSAEVFHSSSRQSNEQATFCFLPTTFKYTTSLHFICSPTQCPIKPQPCGVRKVTDQTDVFPRRSTRTHSIGTLGGSCADGQCAWCGFLNSLKAAHFLHPRNKTGAKYFSLWDRLEIRQKRVEEKVCPSQLLAKNISLWRHVIFCLLEELAKVIDAGCDVAADLNIGEFTLVGGCDAGLDDALFHGGETCEQNKCSMRSDPTPVLVTTDLKRARVRRLSDSSTHRVRPRN